MAKRLSNWVQYSGIGIQMLIIIISFWWFGGKAEDYFILISEPWGQLLGLFLGIFTSMYNLVNPLIK